MNRLIKSFLLFVTASICSANGVSAQEAAGNNSVDALKKSLSPVGGLSIQQLIDQVPTASGLTYVGCPNCKGGAQDKDVFVWQYGMADQVKCRFCNMTFPNHRFPNNGETVVIAPGADRQVYRYYKDNAGRTYYFEARAWYERWQWVQKLASQYAALWLRTGETSYADRAAAILGRFAEVFPDYAVRFDYPSRPVQFFPANQKWPYKGLQPYRGAKWNWWGYNDIPIEMARVYDILQKANYDWSRMDQWIGKQTAKRIQADLLMKGYEHAAANPETYSNMSPGLYRDMISLGRILEEPSVVEDGLKRFREFIKLGFFADGWWKEGATSYHNQTIRSLASVLQAAQIDPSTMPFYKKAMDVSEQAILPNGRKLPINDTWAYDRYQGKGTETTVSRLWPALGNAILGTGTGKDQFALNVNWSGNYGHSHYDNGSILLYALGEELLSDIGYTHTRYRGWTIHTASHNTVVIDQMGQDAGTDSKPATGKLNYYDDTHEHVKVIDLDASPAYEKAKTYRRRLVSVHAGPGHDYVVDIFDVAGGNTHDWFLHGSCEEEGGLQLSTADQKKISTLVPSWAEGKRPETQYDVDMTGKRFHPYLFMTDIQSTAAKSYWTSTFSYQKAGLRSHHFSEPGTRVFQFRSPSVRMAMEDNNKLDNFTRKGLMLRHAGGKSSFIAIHEPFSAKPWIDQVSRKETEIVVQYRLGGKNITDRISLNNGAVKVNSTAGWQYESGTQQSGSIEAFEASESSWRLKLDREVLPVDYIRLDLPGGNTRYCQVNKAGGRWVQLQDDPGFTLEGDKLKFHTFPHDTYQGALKYTLFEKNK